MIPKKIKAGLCLSGILTLIPFVASGTIGDTPYTPALNGFLGLNTVPNARMDQAGTVRAGVSTLDPFTHGFVGIQIADPLLVNFRQTAETSNPIKDAERLLPGVDLKLRLFEETAHKPAISVGLQSAIGHRRMAAEYIALSKRYHDFDFTAGIGWGRFGTSAQFDNPFKIFGSHFKQARDLSSETPNDPSDWFTGDKVGFFGGVEYFLPYDGLSLKLDYGSDRYTVESAQSGFNTPAPWGVGLSYNHNGWISAGIGAQGTDKIMGRVSIQSSPARWPFKNKTYPDIPTFNIDTSDIQARNPFHVKKGADIDNITVEGNHIQVDLHIPEGVPAPQYMGRTLRHLNQISDNDIKTITLNLKEHNLNGTSVTFLRKDIEKALIHNNKSPNELWNNTNFHKRTAHEKSPVALHTNDIPLSVSLDNQFSLSEEDSGILYRSSALINAKHTNFLGFSLGTSLRLNLADNLDKLEDLRPAAIIPIRSDVADFAETRVSLDQAHISYTHTIVPEVHAAISAGYLEEFFAGFGGEILYRPIRSRFAIGIEGWQTYRRDPNTTLNAGLNGTVFRSGHANIWYDIPSQDITAKFSAGRFIAGDQGISFGLEKRFMNGATLNGQVSISNASDPDLFGSTTHAYHSVNLKLPLGSLPYVPTGSAITNQIAPFGRDIAQKIRKPIDLYARTDSFTVDHMAKHWQEILD